MLKSFSSTYSTFWTDASNEYEADLYNKIYNRDKIGCFKVLGVHDCYLIDLKSKNSKNLMNTDENLLNDDLSLMTALRKNSLISFLNIL